MLESRELAAPSSLTLAKSCNEQASQLFAQRLFRNDAHSLTLDGEELEAYEANFDEERSRLHAAIVEWWPEPPIRLEYDQLRNEICAYNTVMRNGYASTGFEFEQQELRGRQEAFKARVRHDLLSGYDGLARACKNLCVPQTYQLLTRKARKAIARTYPELYDLRLFDRWRDAAPEPEREDVDVRSLTQDAMMARDELEWLFSAPVAAAQLHFTDDELFTVLAEQKRPADARKLFFALLHQRRGAPLSFASLQSGLAGLRKQLTRLEECSRVVRTIDPRSQWDEPVEPAWSTGSSADA